LKDLDDTGRTEMLQGLAFPGSSIDPTCRIRRLAPLYALTSSRALRLLGPRAKAVSLEITIFLLHPFRVMPKPIPVLSPSNSVWKRRKRRELVVVPLGDRFRMSPTRTARLSRDRRDSCGGSALRHRRLDTFSGFVNTDANWSATPWLTTASRKCSASGGFCASPLVECPHEADQYSEVVTVVDVIVVARSCRCPEARSPCRVRRGAGTTRRDR